MASPTSQDVRITKPIIACASVRFPALPRRHVPHSSKGVVISPFLSLESREGRVPQLRLEGAAINHYYQEVGIMLMK